MRLAIREKNNNKETDKYKNMWIRAAFLGIRLYKYTLTLNCFYQKMQKDRTVEHVQSVWTHLSVVEHVHAGVNSGKNFIMWGCSSGLEKLHLVRFRLN